MLEASCFSDSNTKKKRALLISEYIPISPFRELYLFPSLSTTGIYLLHLGRRIVLSFDFIDEDVEGQTNNVVNATRTFQLEERTRHSLCWPLDLEPAQEVPKGIVEQQDWYDGMRKSAKEQSVTTNHLTPRPREMKIVRDT